MRSKRGDGDRWAMAADLQSVSLLDVHRTIGGARLFAIGDEHPKPDCAVENVVNEALEDALRGEGKATDPAAGHRQPCRVRPEL